MKKLLVIIFLLIGSHGALAQTNIPDQRPHNGQMAMTNKPNTFQQSVVFKGNATINVTGSTQCLHVNSVGLITGTGSDCGAGGGGVSSLTGDSVVYNNSASTGAVTLSLATQTANNIFAGPSSGGAVAPTFRSLVGADLPNPAASTLGGVESLVATSHQWINTISTSGVPSSTQPAFTDISGAATTTQMPAAHKEAVTAFMRSNQVGSMGVPDQESINGRIARYFKAGTWTGSNNFTGAFQITGTSLPAQAAGTLGLAGTATKPTLGANSEGDMFLTAAGGINLIGQGSTNDFSLFNSGGTSVCTVATGTTTLNCVGLQINGTNVSTTTGTVTSVATNNGVTGGTITTTGTIGLASVSNNSVLCNNSGGSAVPTAANCTTTGTGNAVMAATATLSGTTTVANVTGVGNDYLSGGYIETGAPYTANTSTSYALNIDNGPKQVITITGAVTITLATPTHSGSATFKLLQDGSGHVYSITGCKWAGGTAITYSTAANAYDIVSVWYDGTNSNCMGGAAFQ